MERQTSGAVNEQDLPFLRPRPAVAAAFGAPRMAAPDHVSYFISDVVDQLDLSSITAPYEGVPCHEPKRNWWAKVDGRQNHLRDAVGGIVILGTAILVGSSSFFGWADHDFNGGLLRVANKARYSS